MNQLNIWIEKLHKAERYMSDREHGAAKAVIRQVTVSMELERKRQKELKKAIEKDFIAVQVGADEMANEKVVVGAERFDGPVWMPKSNR